MMVIVRRGGVEKLRLPSAEARKDGTVWCGGVPILDGESPEFVEIGKAQMMELVRAQEWDQIPDGAYARMGDNPSGLEIISGDQEREEVEERHAAIRAARTPAQIEREAIATLYARAESRLDDDDEMNTTDHFHLRGEATARLATWREQYPEDAATEDAANLREQAEHQRDLARGAGTYDADGWLDEGAREMRAQEFTARAEALETEAMAIAGGAR